MENEKRKKKFNLVLSICITVILWVILIVATNQAIAHGLKNPTTAHGKNVCEKMGALIYYFSAIAVKNKDSWLGKLITDIMSKKYSIDVNQYGNVVLNASVSTIFIYLGIALVVSALLVLLIYAILNKNKYVTKRQVLPALAILGLIIGYNNNMFNNTLIIQNVLIAILFIGLILAIPYVFMSISSLIHRKVSKNYIRVSGIMILCVMICVGGLVERNIKNIATVKLAEDMRKGTGQENKNKEQQVGKYNDISSGWKNPETGTYYYGQIIPNNEIVGKSGKTAEQLIEAKGQPGKTYTVTKYYCKTTKETVYCVTSSGGGTQVLDEEGTNFLLLTVDTAKAEGINALEVVLRNMKMGEKMAEAIGGGDTIHAKITRD